MINAIQWNENEWKVHEKNTGKAAGSYLELLINLTKGQFVHPKWYKSPCRCHECQISGL